MLFMTTFVISNILLIVSLLSITNASNISCNFRFGSMTLLSGSRPRKTVAAGFNIALQDYKNGYLYNNPYLNLTYLLNNNNKTAADCMITTNMNDMNSDIKIGIVQAFSFGQSFEKNNISDINIPIVVGPPTSGYSLTLNPLFTAFNLLQFSSTATSTFLSSYKTFFRSVPSDDLQAHALIKLCKYFNWNNIGIMYMNTNYGSSLQQSLTSYAKHNGLESTTFSYIDGDNITISDAVESMKKSGIYINILISYGSDLEQITNQIIKQNMIGYPYYFLGTDSWLGTIGEDATNLDVYGGVIGTCPWSPSLNDPFVDKYPYPINESIQMYIDFNKRWIEYYNNNITKNELLYGYKQPGFFTGYAYDNILTVIKSINEYIKLYGYNMNHTDITSKFYNILHSISFIGLTGNVSYDINGDRANGLFSFCNVDTSTGIAHTIGYVYEKNLKNLSITIDETLIKWPNDYINKNLIPPQFEYIKYEGIPKFLLNIVWSICGISILIAIICMCFLACYKHKPIIKSSQWRLSCVMCIGIIIGYISVMIYGIDENFYSYDDYNWNIYCNYRLLLLNTAFGLVFGALFCKVYRIRFIFNVGKKLQKTILTDTKMAIYNIFYVLIDFILCLILILIIPQYRIYKQSEIYSIEKEFYGNCTSINYWYIYFIILILPKFIFCVYCIIISISVYNTVSMMKYNEGLQVLITVIICILFVLILVIILSIITINSQTLTIFYYGFLSLILLMISNFIIIMMLLPRLVAIWRKLEDEYVKQDKHVEKKINKYLARLAKFKRERSNRNKRTSSTEQSTELSSINRKETGDDENMTSTPITPNNYDNKQGIPMFNIQKKQLDKININTHL